MKYAIIQAAGKQYKVTPGQEIIIDQQAGNPGDKIDFSEVLLLVNEGECQIGKPTVEKAVVKAEIVEHLKGEKIRVAKFKAKARYRKVTGHRQHQSKIKIVSIS